MEQYIAITNLSERLTSPGFSNEIIDGASLSPYSYYTCACGQNVRFERRHLEDAEQSVASAIGQETIRAIEAIARKYVQPNDSFLDFNCPACHKPIRIYFRSWAGGKHGDCGFDWRFIIEKK